jgi:hypothetical protein
VTFTFKQRLFMKFADIFHGNLSNGSRGDLSGQTDGGGADMNKLLGAFRDSANATKKTAWTPNQVKHFDWVKKRSMRQNEPADIGFETPDINRL